MAWTVAFLIITGVAVGPLAAREIVEHQSYNNLFDSPTNDTDKLVLEEEADWGLAAERGRCPNTEKCDIYGGSCIKLLDYCDGIEVYQNCKGKNCKCCIPYKPTCPTLTLCDESQGFMSVLGRCFKLFTDVDRTWYQSVVKCRAEGMVMVTTTDADADIIRDALIKTYGNSNLYAWLDAKYNGAQYVFNTGEQIENGSGLWYTDYFTLKPDYCLGLLNRQDFMDREPTKPYYTTLCASTEYGRKAFCELLV